MLRVLSRLAAAAVVALQLSACASPGKMAPAGPAPATVKSGEAQLVLMRSTFVGSAISASVWDTTGKDARFVGIIENGSKLIVPLKPGQHTFMVVGESADFMQANVAAGKTYYAMVIPRPGVWKARFSFKPLRQADFGGSDFAEWNSKTTYVVNTPESTAWAAGAAASIAEKRGEYWPEWSGKAADQRASQTLNAGDGK